MRAIILLATVLFLPLNCFAWTEEMKCHAGNCDQWSASYNRQGDDIAIKFNNISGKPLFKIKATIFYYNYMGEYLGQHYVKMEGPIHKYFNAFPRVTSNTSRIEYDINCVEEYEGAQIPIKGE